ncbi:DUF4145 domain-containing protein [Streptococcus parauberis]|uniref:DUF4145 domain-containing protein n=1 Tax=Streptococcus parauberis TaxID=1348 RepID=UPI000789BF2D|nr:DUF4145 domain-containing protein [Streptococcus parauberis]KYP21679.1 hypothetical protein AKL14_00590 [Streptococcus parauberis]KYP21853.1 hypothetical protein AKL13_00353 [Streptococcus parauberis]KYP21929.1 hypothetical protein TN39_00178 [Streptococcus parauberis]KYP23745.1 hypothetical protein ADO04_01621 [Streptococcus parauberis]KYP25342.1 hypothetical protein TP84_01644 [Streptococcus parauberis]
MSNIFDDIDSNYFILVNSLKCPVCDVVATQVVSKNLVTLKKEPNVTDSYFHDYVVRLKCHSCNCESVWITRKLNKTHPKKYSKDKDESFYKKFEFEKLLYPFSNNDTPGPNNDMPDNVLNIYNEACLVLQHSPRSSIALSRLAIEQLVEYLGAEGKTLDKKIGNLVSKGLPVTIQQMLDSVRVIGNNAVHPGQIEVEGNTDLAISLLKFINLIVDSQISQPKAIQATYDLIPDSYKKSIERRDNK